MALIKGLKGKFFDYIVTDCSVNLVALDYV